MYKAVIIAVLAVLLLPFAAAQATAPAPSPQQINLQQVQQQVSILVKKEVQDSERRINENMDTNFRVFDDRMFSMLRSFLQKMIIGLLGGMTVVLVGYAWLTSYISRKYTTVYQRNIVKTKLQRAVDSGKVFVEGTMTPFSQMIPQPVASPAESDPNYPSSQNPFYVEPVYKQEDTLGTQKFKTPKVAPLQMPNFNTQGGQSSADANDDIPAPPQFRIDDDKKKGFRRLTMFSAAVVIVLGAVLVLRRLGVV